MPASSAGTTGGQRPELERADALGAAAGAQQRAARAALWPSLSLGVDAGTQGEDWDFGPEYNYLAASLVFSWKLFDGGVNRAEAERALALHPLPRSGLERQVRAAAARRRAVSRSGVARRD